MLASKKENKNIMHEKIVFNFKYEGKKATTYNCTANRGKEPACTKTIHVSKLDGSFRESGTHAASCVSQPVANGPALDLTKEMKEKTDKQALKDLALGPAQIADMILAEMNEKSKTGTGLTHEQVVSRVKKCRTNAFGGDVFRLIEQPKYALVKGSKRFFLQFNLTIPNEQKGRFDRIICWGHPALFGILKGRSPQLFIDGTFRCVPSLFHQCLIIMAYDDQNSEYVPLMYVLMTGRTETLYWHALHNVIVASGWKLEPFSITCDFEKALHNAIGDQFPHAITNGCFFHFKQANRKKMRELGFDSEVIARAMSPYAFDILNIINHDEIVSKGIPYVRLILETENMTTEDNARWEAFWRYFMRFWMSSPTFMQHGTSWVMIKNIMTFKIGPIMHWKGTTAE